MFKEIEITDDVFSTLRRLFQTIFEDLTIGSKPTNLVRLTVQSPSLDYPIIIPFLRIKELTPDRFMSEIERVLQSNEDFVIDESLLLEVTLVDMPAGGARKKCKFVNTEKFLQTKKCILQIQNNDDLCCARAIVTAKARIEKHEKWESIRKCGNVQETMAIQLHTQAGVALVKCGVEEVKLFQKIMPQYQIHVISQQHFNGIIYKGPESEKKIYLYLHDGHFDVITSMPAFLGRSYYCTKCDTGYSNKEDHKCNNVCYACRKIHKEDESEWIYCKICNRFFRGRICFDLHSQTTSRGNSTCASIYRCSNCNKTVNKKIDSKHVCGRIYCNRCKDFYPEEHLCYMLPEDNQMEDVSIEEEIISEEENAKTFIFFDFE